MQRVEDTRQWRQFFAPLGNVALSVDQVLDQLLPLTLHTQFSMLVQELVHVLGFTTPQFSVRTRGTVLLCPILTLPRRAIARNRI